MPKITSVAELKKKTILKLLYYQIFKFGYVFNDTRSLDFTWPIIIGIRSVTKIVKEVKVEPKSNNYKCNGTTLLMFKIMIRNGSKTIEKIWWLWIKTSVTKINKNKNIKTFQWIQDVVWTNLYLILGYKVNRG